MDTDQPITVQNSDSVPHPPPPPPKEINGFISETIQEEDREIIIEDSLKQIESFLQETKAADGADVVVLVDEYVSDQVKTEEQSLDVALPLAALADREYSAVPTSDGEPEVVVAAIAKEKEEEEVDQALEVKEEFEEEKSVEPELPVSLDRSAVDNCNLQSVQFSGGTENAGENQTGGVVTTNQLVVHHSSWKDCCGLFDVLRRHSNQ